MVDEAHEWTDEQIEALQRKYAQAYREAEREMRQKLEASMRDFEAQNERWRQAVRNGDKTDRQWREWREDQLQDQRWIRDMADTLASDAANANQIAADDINDMLPRVYAENANRAAYAIESAVGREIGGFGLYDVSTVRRLMGMGEYDQLIHEVIPVGPPHEPLQSLRVHPDRVKDVEWNRQKFTSAITQSILQGESIPHTAERLSRVLKMDENMATRAARTAMTSAENAGRVDSFKRAKSLGIDLEQQWMATLDGRTRHSHRLLDGQHVPVGEKFKVDGVELEYPGDPSAPGEYTWNCRCTLVAWSPTMEADDPARNSKLPKGMSYDDWKGMKEQQQQPNDGNPETLGGVKRGEPMDFDKANELRGNPKYNMADKAYDELNEARSVCGQAAAEHGFSSPEYTEAVRKYDDARRAYNRARQEQEGYRINCQTCVVANEARRRGYDVQATANTRGSVNARVSRDTNLAWIDPATGRHPEYIRYDGAGRTDVLGRPIPTPRRFTDWLLGDGTIEEGARYTIEHAWRGRSLNGHIVCLERTPEGLRMYDPQCGEIYDEGGIRRYFQTSNTVAYSVTRYGSRYSVAPQLLKVSEYEFDTDICDQILEEAR